MKKIYASLLPLLFLCNWSFVQAFDSCESRLAEIKAVYSLEKQEAQSKYDQVYAKTNAWFKEAKRTAPSVKAMYRMRTKHEEALSALNSGFAKEQTRIETRHQIALADWKASCSERAASPKPVETKEPPFRAENKVIEKKEIKVQPQVVETPPRKPKKKKKRKAKAEAAYQAQVTSLLNEAQKYLRTPYRYGGNTPKQGFDCSGYMKYVYQKEGITLPRVSKEQAKEGQKVKRNDAQAGDLVYFGPRKGKITHIGMVISDPGEKLKMIHASSSRGVEITEIDGIKYWEKRLQGFRRVLK